MRYTQKKFLKSKLGKTVMVVTLEDDGGTNCDVVEGTLLGFDNSTLTLDNIESINLESLTLVYIRNIIRIQEIKER